MRAAPPAQLAWPERPPRPATGSAFPFACDRLRGSVLDRADRRPVGLLADEDPVDGRRGLHPRGRVHARRPQAIPSPSLGASIERDDRLAGVDRRSGCGGRATGPPRSARRLRLEDGERGANGALGVVLVRDRRAEERDDRVADELLDRAAEALELGRGAARSRASSRASDVFGVELLGAAPSSRRCR